MIIQKWMWKKMWKTFLNVIQRDGIGEGEVQDELVDDLGFGEKPSLFK